MKKRIKKSVSAWAQVVSLALVAALSLCATGPASAQAQAGSDPAALAATLENAVGSDVNAALALFSDDATLKITPPPQGTPGTWVGTEQLREALQYSKDHAVKRQIVGTPQVQGNTVTYVAAVSNDVFQHLGVAPVQFSTVVVVEGGKIKSFVSTILPSEQGRVAAAAAKAQQTGAAPGTTSATVGMPKTGSSELDNTALWLALLGALCLLAGTIMIRTYLPRKNR